MTVELAQEICKLMLDIGGKLDRSVNLVKDNSAPAGFDLYRASVGRIMGYIYSDILKPIYREHPSLVPDELKQN